MNAPGSFVPCDDRFGTFELLWKSLGGAVFAVVDARVATLHPKVRRAIQKTPHVLLRAGEQAKSVRSIDRLGAAAISLGRDATVVAIGGGTIGDVATVYAHLHKRGCRLIHVPTTVLAAVDSSVGGKGAVNVAGVKNALGVFHAPTEGWVCAEFFSTLTRAQMIEGENEAWKMAVTLNASVWRTWTKARPTLGAMVQTSRSLKSEICTADPYEQTGRRVILNFGHTFGHVIESLTHYRVRHGAAVGLGMICALDVGARLGVTQKVIADEVEQLLPMAAQSRVRLARILSKCGSIAEIAELLKSDKKGSTTRATRFVLLKKPGECELADVPHAVWKSLLSKWKRGQR